MRFRALIVGAVLAAFPVFAQAAQLAPNSQLDIVGNINPASTFAESTFMVDFVDSGLATIATGDFDAYVVDFFEGGAPTLFTMNDLNGTGSQVVYSGGGFTFTATSFFNFVPAPSTPRGFEASGVFSGNGFDDTPGIFAFSTQSVGNENVAKVSFSSETVTSAIPLPAGFVLLGTALAGLGIARRKKAGA